MRYITHMDAHKIAKGANLMDQDTIDRIMAKHNETLQLMADTECEDCGYWYGEHDTYCDSHGIDPYHYDDVDR